MTAVPLPFGTAARLWAAVWSWCYPAAGEALRESLRAARGQRGAASQVLHLALWSASAPSLARSQGAAERNPATRTADSPPLPAEPSWRGHAREALVWLTMLGAATAAAAVVASLIATGGFVFESSAAPGQPEAVSAYFTVAAVALTAPVLPGLAGVLLLRPRRG